MSPIEIASWVAIGLVGVVAVLFFIGVYFNWKDRNKTGQNKYRCLQCGKEFPKAFRIPVWYKGKITTYKCPYCRGKIEKVGGS